MIECEPLRLANPGAEAYVPDEAPLPEALARTTHLAVAAHQDDIEIMAYRGILECFGSNERWFAGVVVTNGASSPRQGYYASCTEEEMLAIRRREQRKAALVGEYSAVLLLDYPSPQVRDAAQPEATEDLRAVLAAARPEVVYTHNLADKHDAHVAVALRTIDAIRTLPEDARPRALLGCEVWRDLDWMTDDDKVALDVQAHENLAAALLGVYDSQITGGKRYDLAALGRRRAHATYHSAFATDNTGQLTFAMDMTPLIGDTPPDVRSFLRAHVERFAEEVDARLVRVGGTGRL